ncbi:hypothetical protein O7542_03030 [Micromonospora sp. WMMC264]|uniref:hypothetical protein n=1 Tax=Micromonospora sp. WMMC264 TaxID=3015158 RepID=UPI00248CB87B|nr:hypothetical protein [Micromonospora sp. WMMC264]WBB86134.1 hypothetical protein O7542_03030 [Micromonospora sp. WMMC264]
MDAFKIAVENSSKRLLTYIVLVLASITIGAFVGLWRAIALEGYGDGRKVSSSRLELNVVQELSRATRRILVVGLSIPSFSSEQALRTYDAILGRGVQIDLVLVNPLSPSLLQRPRRLYSSLPHPSLTAARTLNTLTHYAAGLSEHQRARFRVHIANSLPTAGIVIVDSECIWHPYLNQATGVASPYIRESTDSGYGIHIARYAESLAGPPSSFAATRDPDRLARELEEDPEISFAYTEREVGATRKALAE